ncbi:MAG: hypothetical protein KF724_11105 [Phycisphaeraceae bacterium]|nr:hypothetical protein [Phycisphaeraceae bacterium]
MGFSREIWVQLGSSAAEGRRAWQQSGRRGGLERALWIAATVLLAIPIFALLVVALLGATALTFAALCVAWIWGLLARIGLVRSRQENTVIRVSPHRSDP